MKIVLKSGKVIGSLSRKGFVLKVKTALKRIVAKILKALRRAVDAFWNELISIGDHAAQKMEIRDEKIED